MLDSYASFASASFRGPGSPVGTRQTLYSRDLNDEALSSGGSDLGIDGEVVDLAAEMVPTFFESGQLMWEMSARTERLSSDQEPSMMHPEIVLTDSSFLSVSVVQDDLDSQEDIESEQHSRNEAGDEQDNFDQRELQALTGQHCFELLTDEDGPLCSNASDATELSETDGAHAKPKLDEANDAQPEASASSSTDKSAASEPISTLSCPVHSVIDDCDWMERQYRIRRLQDRMPQAQGMNQGRSFLMDSAPSLMIPSASRDVESLRLADSASDILATYDPDYFIAGFQETPRQRRALTMRGTRLPMLTQISLSQPFEISKSGMHLNLPQLSGLTPDPSPRRRPNGPGCSLKDIFTSAMSKFNEVLYNCTHAKQRRQERKILKKLTSSKENMTPSSSAPGVYRRRHTLICQKMEGMINNEAKAKQSLKKVSRSRTPSIAAVRHATPRSGIRKTAGG